MAAAVWLVSGPVAAQVPDAWAACVQAAGEAETAAGLPDGILAAIGRVESGRTDPASGRRVPWPFTVNVDGTGHRFESGAEAVAYTQAALAGHARSIDVGCFQVNLQAHPSAFAGLVEAFDPSANAAYAGRLLARHFAAAGTWGTAAGWYHSMTPGLGDAYSARVMAEWRGVEVLGARAGAVAHVLPSSPRVVPVVWRPGAADPSTRFGVRVFTPGGPSR